MKLFLRYTCFFGLLLLFITMNTSVMGQYGKAVTEVKGLAVGSTAPRFTATDAEGRKYNLAKALKKGLVVLLF